MKDSIKNRRTIWRATTVAAALAVGASAFHIACKQDGSTDFSGVKNVFKPAAQVFGNAAGVDSRATDTAVALIDYTSKVSVKASEEDAMGQSVAVSLTNTYQLTKDEKLNKYVSLVGLTIVDASDRPVGNWQFGVLETPEVNAFAGPNGYIFITRGALNRMDNEAQLAGVLAHEVTHVLHHHGLEGVKNEATGELGKELFTIYTNDPTGLAKEYGGRAVKAVVTNPYGQAQENDADVTAIKLLVASGYDPNGLPEFLQRLESAGGGLFSTHPGKPERIAKTRAQIAKLGNPRGKTLVERFQANVKTK